MITIRPMTMADVDGVMTVERASFKTPWSREAFERELTVNHMAHYLVAIIDQQVIGYAGFWQVIDEGHITNIAIAPQWRTKGHGKLLVEQLLNDARAKEIAYMTLEVRVNNHSAINLYRQFGFIDHGVRPNYYYDTGEDALIMWAKLK